MKKYPARKFSINIVKTNIGNLDSGYKIEKDDELGLPEINARWIPELLKKLEEELQKIGYC